MRQVLIVSPWCHIFSVQNINTILGWMTAELFVKLSSKLYADRKHLLQDPDTESEYGSNPDPQTYQLSSSEDDSEPGGALLLDFTNHDPNGTIHPAEGLVTVMGDDHLPPAYHERQLQLAGGHNRFATLSDLGETLPDGPELPKPKQWIPTWDSSFWDIYVNKLRVNATEFGVCDLNGDG
jgi:hypothetical protein